MLFLHHKQIIIVEGALPPQIDSALENFGMSILE
ncbi:MAG: hypothetical protein CM15mP22_7210 [Gammaproteobacteria bacterium]|nr:MAG: hypothetical protein CM15mP22_7210 [Gammaproteobacteria bacterium]